MLVLECLVRLLESLPVLRSEDDTMEEQEAIGQLELGQAAENDLDQFLCCMSVIMADHKKFSLRARRCAVLQLQLYLNTKSSGPQMEQQLRWRAMATGIRNTIKDNLLAALSTSSCYSYRIAEILAYVVVMEMPLKNNWPDLIPILSHHIFQLENEEKESAMEALTSICQKLNTESMAEYCGEVMAPLLVCLRMDHLSNRAQQAALDVLLSCFELAHAYFVNPREHKIVMQAICKAAESTDINIRSSALSLLNKAASFCYEHLEEYIDFIVPITTEAMKSQEDIHVKGLEFWKTVSQVENPRDSEGRRIPIMTQSKASKYFVENNRTNIVPCLFAQLVRGEVSAYVSPENPGETYDFPVKAEPTYDDAVFTTEVTTTEVIEIDVSNATEKRLGASDTVSKVNPTTQRNRNEILKKNQSSDSWMPPREVIIYFSELCENYPDTIDRYVLPLVENEIQHSDWRHRHAALWSMLVFLKQIDPNHAEKSLEHIFPLIRRTVRDRESSRIRSTSLWVISWMIEKYPALLTLPETYQDLQRFLYALMACLNDDEGRVSPSSCTALTSIIKASYTLSQQKTEGNLRPTTFILSPYYDMIADQLVKAAKRRLTAAFEALRQLLLNSPDDCYWVVLETTDELLLLLRKVIELPDRVGCQCHETVQKLICGILQSVIKVLKLGKATSNQLCHKSMTYLLSLLTKFPAGMAREEALVTALKIAPMLDWELKYHADSLASYLILAISSCAKGDPALPLIVDLVGTFFHVLDSEAMPYVSNLLGQLLILTDSNQRFSTEVKIRCIAAFGQIATAVGRTGFQPYMAAAVRRIQYYGELSTTEEMLESNSSRKLRERLQQTCLETYSSFLQSILHRGITPSTLDSCSGPVYLTNIAKLIQSIIASQSNLAKKTLTAMGHLVGNLLLEFGKKKALAFIPLKASDCISLLADVLHQTKGNEQVYEICRAALSEMERDARRLN